jgi:hypothetical protein
MIARINMITSRTCYENAQQLGLGAAVQPSPVIVPAETSLWISTSEQENAFSGAFMVILLSVRT